MGDPFRIRRCAIAQLARVALQIEQLLATGLRIPDVFLAAIGEEVIRDFGGDVFAVQIVARREARATAAQVSSGLVIAFIWQMMYYPTETGFFNAVLLQLGWITRPLEFLFDPNWALVWVTMPSVWAGIGGGSLIYLAALKTVSDDLYEAAETDGAGFWQKLVRITIPTLLPIILINFVGTFIGLFKSMGNIFLLTGGGPGDETTVISLNIWRDSFLFLKFGTATATARILAAMLMSFTVVQLRILSRVEFRRAEE